jgi:hypothetical protein
MIEWTAREGPMVDSTDILGGFIRLVRGESMVTSGQEYNHPRRSVQLIGYLSSS